MREMQSTVMNEMRAVIDRIEGKMTVLIAGEENVKFDFPLALLPQGCKEGDVLNISIERDPEATQQAREKVSSLMEKLKKKGQGKTGIIRDQ
ncbi:Uncharacterised protein [uncultured archaeon]|nr:Uncharacterised protein [uncultured archaeon]